MPFSLEWEIVTMPPRTPIAAAGVAMVAPPVWVAWPPTTRNNPFVRLSATSPSLVAGLKTNLSITIRELTPMFSVVLSMNNSWTLPEPDVSIFSLRTTWLPISMTRVAPPGGVLRDLVLTALALPTFCA